MYTDDDDDESDRAPSPELITSLSEDQYRRMFPERAERDFQERAAWRGLNREGGKVLILIF